MSSIHRRHASWRTCVVLASLALVATALTVPVPSFAAKVRPDLVVSAVSDPPAKASAGSSFTVSVTTGNLTTARTKATVTRFYLSADAAWDGADALLTGQQSVPVLTSKAPSATATVTLTLPWTVTPTPYRLIACADDTRLVAEANEANNCTTAAGVITFPSSQELIRADLEAGVIDHPTSLIYRIWALFGDAQLPAAYDGGGSVPEDSSLFFEIDEVWDTLSAETQAALIPYLVRPTDPRSAFGPAAAPASGARVTAAAAGTPTGTECLAPNQWFGNEWSPSLTDPDVGIKVWECGSSQSAVDADINEVLGHLVQLWGPMTTAEPDGMGEPLPDTANDSKDTDGNGKIDIYLVQPNQYRERDGVKQPIPSGFGGLTRPVRQSCAPMSERVSCSAFVQIARERISLSTLKGLLAHEFFHVLQVGHNAWDALYKNHWYPEASAEWATYRYARDSYWPELVQGFANFQVVPLSLLNWGEGYPNHQYASWIWPLFMQLEASPQSVFRTWQAAESVTTAAGLDDVVDAELPFIGRFRDFAVRNLNPAEYFDEPSTGLWGNVWQTAIPEFPTLAPALASNNSLTGPRTVDVGFVEPLAPQYDRFEIPNTAASSVRKIIIDVGGIGGADHADLDVVARLVKPDGSTTSTWRRISGGDEITLCRDEPDENVDLFYVVLSNHSRARTATGPDDAASLKGSYSIKTAPSCGVPDGYMGTFGGSDELYYVQAGILNEVTPVAPMTTSWAGTATFALEGLCPGVDPNEGNDYTYCYRLTAADVTWRIDAYSGTNDDIACSAPGAEGSFQLDPATSDEDLDFTADGALDLTTTAADGTPIYTYGGSILAGQTGFPSPPYPALDLIVTCSGSYPEPWTSTFPFTCYFGWSMGCDEDLDTWLSAGFGMEPIPSSYRLAGVVDDGLDGYSWDFTPTYGGSP